MRAFLGFSVLFLCGVGFFCNVGITASPVPFSPVGQVLLIGDSLSCGPFGKYLVQEIASRGNTVTLFCAVSSTPENWLAGKNPKGQLCGTMTSEEPSLRPCGGNGQIPRLSDILSLHEGASIVVELGTNSLLSPNAGDAYSEMAKAVSSSGKSCDWIGPPELHPSESKGFPPGRITDENENLSAFYLSLSKQVGPKCALIDSRSETAPGTAGYETVDGVHRTDAAGRYWAEQIASQFEFPGN